MKSMIAVAGLVVTALGSPVAAQDTTAAQDPAAAPAAAITVEAVLARSVMDREPQDTGTTFPSTVGEIVLWTRVMGGEGQTVNHVWFYGDTEVGNVPLTIGGSSWRTWSRKTVPVEATGAWHVEVRDAAGNVLERIDFSVEAAPAQPAETPPAPAAPPAR
ncbi:MAG: DUF2914 domain-containing protein [Gemmatimonadales bacterium]